MQFEELVQLVNQLPKPVFRGLMEVLRTLANTQALEDEFWDAFVVGAQGHPISSLTKDKPKKIKHLKDSFDANIANGAFNNAQFKATTKDCCQRAGEIARSLAIFRNHPKIQPEDLELAYETLRNAGGSSGGLC